MILRWVVCVITAVFVQQTLAQSCQKFEDCAPNAHCRHQDFYKRPNMWPPCPHGGSCACDEGYAAHPNGSCIPHVKLSLGDHCTGAPWEIIRIPGERCSSRGIVECNAPTYQRNTTNTTFCELLPTVPIPAPPAVITGPTCKTVTWLKHCNGLTTCCQGGVGLRCAKRGINSTYHQCQCRDNTKVFDANVGLCRKRIYGDACAYDEDCSSPYIGKDDAVECRLGRCRCKTGYIPYDSTYFNETSLTTYTWRICLIKSATTWVPTGQECTMEPQLFSSRDSTRVCHKRAFCHLCAADRSSFNPTDNRPTTGTCRELTCDANDQCGDRGVCNSWKTQVDPPCSQGMCDCNWADSLYKDRFSRCSSYRKLSLGDRCIVPDSKTQLHPWYPNNEDWPDTMECVAAEPISGYAGYNIGIVSCKYPLVEDADGTCMPNNVEKDPWTKWLSHSEYCDDSDYRLPLKRCDNSTGLQCLRNGCRCPTWMQCESGYGSCELRKRAVEMKNGYWDGSRCKARGSFGDKCNRTNDCCGGICNKGICSCENGYERIRFSTRATIQNGDNRIVQTVVNKLACFRNATIVEKGSFCHLDPLDWDCGNSWRYGNPVRSLHTSTRVCAKDLVCMRCPADFAPENKNYGICRSVRRIPETKSADDSKGPKAHAITDGNSTSNATSADSNNSPSMDPSFVYVSPLLVVLANTLCQMFSKTP